jgi:hypothetical protein
LKKIAAISLLVLLLFNFVGYRLVFNYFERFSDKKMEARLDASEYNEEELLEMKIPINLPYQNNWKSFERYDGEISFNGRQYKYVKRKVTNDTLYILIAPNKAKEKIEKAELGYFKSTNDVGATAKDKKAVNVLKIFSPEFRELNSIWNLSAPDNNSHQNYPEFSAQLQKGIYRFMERPPQC